jgi:hypothetical protein
MHVNFAHFLDEYFEGRERERTAEDEDLAIAAWNAALEMSKEEIRMGGMIENRIQDIEDLKVSGG